MIFVFSKRAAATTAALFIIGVATAAQAARPDFNRAGTYDAQHYVLRVSFDRAKRTVFGDVTVRIKPLKPGFAVAEFDAVDLNFESVVLEPGGTVLQYKATGGKVIVALDRAYAPEDEVGIRFKYSAKPKKGVYFVDELKKPDGSGHSAQIWTQGEPNEHRHWFPSFDFPSDKATTEQFITAPKGETVIGNGELVTATENGDGTVTHHFRMDTPFSTYLISFIVGRYEKVEEKYRGIPLGFYVYPGRESVVPLAYGRTKDMMAAFEKITGVEYPFKKYDQTIVSAFNFGGMENITATTMADSEIFFSQIEFLRGNVEDLVSHELAHSWFGNNVTCRNWAELWLNEGFATFMEAAVRERFYGRKEYLRKIGRDAESFMADDAVGGKRFGLFNQTAHNVDALFDRPAITYNKGGAVVHMLREQVGDENFWKAVNLYLTRHRFSNVETTDLQNVMEEVSGQQLGWFFDQWVYGIGHPKISIAQTYIPRTKTLRLTVRQTHQAGGLVPASFRLPLELTLKTSANRTEKENILVTRRIQTFNVSVAQKPQSITVDPDKKVVLVGVKVLPLK
jgi:aminopeptidase N